MSLLFPKRDRNHAKKNIQFLAESQTLQAIYKTNATLELTEDLRIGWNHSNYLLLLP